MGDLLTITAAAKRVDRSRRTIERWISEGLPVIWVSNIRYVTLDALLTKLRQRNLADPSKGRELSRPQRAGRHLKRKYTR